MESPTRQLVEVNPSFLARSRSLGSACVICNFMTFGFPRIGLLQAMQ
jgi:hypothetical protein